MAIAPGNHDPFTEDSTYLIKDFWPENVIFFKSELERIEIESLGVRLFGASFTESCEVTPMLKNITFPKDEIINICVLHGELVASNQKGKGFQLILFTCHQHIIEKAKSYTCLYFRK